jgi:formyltetrahydrofolate deformylase
MPEYVLTLACADQVGIVHAVTGYLASLRCTILDSQQFGDPDTVRFFMRVHFATTDEPLGVTEVRTGFTDTARRFAMDWQITDSADRPRMLIMVSRLGHCLNDLLYRWRTGALAADVAAVASNHTDLQGLAGMYQVPFIHLPVTPNTRTEQERALLAVISEHRIDLVVLARYMQILSDDLCASLAGRVINIHHSFLPSFKGAKPYRQAFDRGVKLIGATAHYVTSDLDEGPIIDQEVARVDHTHSVERLEAVGRDVEALALARAVQAHAERRVLLNGSRTVVFR